MSHGGVLGSLDTLVKEFQSTTICGQRLDLIYTAKKELKSQGGISQTRRLDGGSMSEFEVRRGQKRRKESG